MSKINTTEMLTRLQHSENRVIAEKSKAILEGRTTIKEEFKFAGGFFRAVLLGDYNEALNRADEDNTNALTLLTVKN